MICSRPLSPGDVLNGPCAECGHPSLAHRRAHFDAELSYCPVCDIEHLLAQMVGGKRK